MTIKNIVTVSIFRTLASEGKPAGGSYSDVGAVQPATVPSGYPPDALKSIGAVGISDNTESEIRNRNIFISFEPIYISCHCWYKYSMIFV